MVVLHPLTYGLAPMFVTIELELLRKHLKFKHGPGADNGQPKS